MKMRIRVPLQRLSRVFLLFATVFLLGGCEILLSLFGSDTTLDTTPPTITLLGQSQMTVSQGSIFQDPGATAIDDVDGDITGSIVKSGTVNVSSPGTYSLHYDVTDSSRNAAARVTRTVTVVVVDTTPPVITLVGSSVLTMTIGSFYFELGYEAYDAIDGDLTDQVVVSGSVDTSTLGTYVVTYNVSDAASNPAVEVARTIHVIASDTTPPTLSLVGSAEMTVIQNQIFSDPGATAIDDVDGDISSEIVVTGTVDTAVIGTYTIYYDVSDSSGNAATQISRSVVVEELTNTPPVAVAGDDRTVTAGFHLLDAGASFDAEGQELTYVWTVQSTPDTKLQKVYKTKAVSVPLTKVGVYTFTLQVSDGQSSSEDSITITILNAAPKVIFTTATQSLENGQSVHFSVTVSDGNGDATQSALEFTSAPAGSPEEDLTIEFSDYWGFYFEPDIPGTYTLEVTATDGDLTTTKSITFNVVLELEGGINVDIQ